MFNNKQFEIAEFLLKYMKNNGGKTSKDDYPSEFENNGYYFDDYYFVINYLVNHLELIKYLDDSEYIIILTPKGYSAADKTLKKYLSDIEEEKDLEKNIKKLNYKSIKQSILFSRIAILISIISIIIAILSFIKGILR